MTERKRYSDRCSAKKTNESFNARTDGVPYGRDCLEEDSHGLGTLDHDRRCAHNDHRHDRCIEKGREPRTRERGI